MYINKITYQTSETQQEPKTDWLLIPFQYTKDQELYVYNNEVRIKAEKDTYTPYDAVFNEELNEWVDSYGTTSDPTIIRGYKTRICLITARFIDDMIKDYWANKNPNPKAGLFTSSGFLNTLNTTQLDDDLKELYTQYKAIVNKALEDNKYFLHRITVLSQNIPGWIIRKRQSDLRDFTDAMLDKYKATLSSNVEQSQGR